MKLLINRKDKMTKLQKQTIEYVNRNYGSQPIIQTIIDYVKTDGFLTEVKTLKKENSYYKPNKFNTLFDNAINIIINIYSS